jgi:lysine/ornithine N-monooxygenase
MKNHTELLIIGAGPYGLSLAAHVQNAGLDFTIVGKPLAFWKENMPRDMMLRSGLDWHLDTQNEHTFKAFIEHKKLDLKDITPVPINVFLGYAHWFQQQKNIQVQENFVQQLNLKDQRYHALLDNGETITAKRAVLAIGFSGFQHVPETVINHLPEGRYDHTATLVEFDALDNKRVLIVGGRQSALEWAALIHEHGAREVHVSHRHDTPPLKESNWSWVPKMAMRTATDSGWFQRQTEAEREEIAYRFWVEGRLKLEPWLGKRLDHPTIKFWPNTEVTGADDKSDGSLNITLNQHQSLTIDHVVLATGYRVDLKNIPFLVQGNCLPQIKIDNGFPVLDEQFQSSLNGLYFTSFAATQDFGPFFGFTVGCVAASTALGQHLIQTSTK